MKTVANRARQVEETKLEQKYDQFQHQIKKFHEKLVKRKELLNLKQYKTKMANEVRSEQHLKISQSV